jgi:hypothetical protein
MYSILTNDLVYRRIKQACKARQNTNSKKEPLIEMVAAHEPLHLVEYKLTLQVMETVFEVQSVRRVVRESQVEKELARVKETYEQLYLFSRVVNTETTFILKDLGAYNLAVVTPNFVDGDDRFPLRK